MEGRIEQYKKVGRTEKSRYRGKIEENNAKNEEKDGEIRIFRARSEKFRGEIILIGVILREK